MLTRPADLEDAAVLTALFDGWGLDAREIVYRAVGFGSHHWTVTSDAGDRFLTVDDLEARRRSGSESRADAHHRLDAALRTAHDLRGLDGVVAPIPTRTGALTHPVDDRYVLAAYPLIDGTTHAYGPFETPAQRVAVVGRLAALHRAARSSATLADDLAIPCRDELGAAMTEPSTSSRVGPYALPAARLLARHDRALRGVLDRYDASADRVRRRTERFVTTHGEPHRGNTIDTGTGVVLIDWDTALLAPPERDLWALVDEDPTVADVYVDLTGNELDGETLDVYRLWWDLCEVALYTAAFRRPHADDADSAASWVGLRTHLDPRRWTLTDDRRSVR